MLQPPPPIPPPLAPVSSRTPDCAVAAFARKAALASITTHRSPSALRTLCAELLATNPKIVADVKSGKEQAVGQLIGQAKKKNPNVNPGELRTICLELIKGM